MALLIVDYSNAFPALSQNLIPAVVIFIRLLQGFVELLLSSLMPAYFFLVGSTVSKEHVFRLGARIRQEDHPCSSLFVRVL